MLTEWFLPLKFIILQIIRLTKGKILSLLSLNKAKLRKCLVARDFNLMLPFEFLFTFKPVFRQKEVVNCTGFIFVELLFHLISDILKVSFVSFFVYFSNDLTHIDFLFGAHPLMLLGFGFSFWFWSDISHKEEYDVEVHLVFFSTFVFIIILTRYIIILL